MDYSPACPISSSKSDCVTLAHGEGGRLSRELLLRIFDWLEAPQLGQAGDAALLTSRDTRLAFTSDSYVVTPLFFPGGDIGSLAVNGTINDLAVAGAEPIALSLALIIEEGLPLSTLERILVSVSTAARAAGVQVRTGDTKVLPRGACDKLFINTSGVGEIRCELPGPSALSPDDVLLTSGPLGRHGMAVMAARESLNFDPPPESDCASLLPLVKALLEAEIPVKAMRDATRGGLSAVLHEWAAACGHSMSVDCEQLPQSASCRGVAELLGLDLLHVACEGTMILAVPPWAADEAVSILRQHKSAAQAASFGQVVPRLSAPVVRRQLLGQLVAIDEPAGAPLPRIC